MKDLQDQFGVKTLAEAKKLLIMMERQATQEEKEYRSALKQFERNHPEIIE